jgi:hypothetical protein
MEMASPVRTMGAITAGMIVQPEGSPPESGHITIIIQWFSCVVAELHVRSKQMFE